MAQIIQLNENLHMVDLQVYSYLILAPISFVFEIFMIIAFLKVKKFREPPGFLIVWQVVTQSCIDIHMIHSAFYYLLSPSYFFTNSCISHGFVVIYMLIANWTYILSLSIDVMIRLVSSQEFDQSRQKYFHIFAHLLALTASSLAWGFGGIGLSENSTCFIKEGSWTELYLLILIVYYPINLACIIMIARYAKSSSNQTANSYAVRLLWFLVAFIVLSLPGCLCHIFKSYYVGVYSDMLFKLAIVFNSTTGLITCLVRLSAPEVLDLIFNKTHTEIMEPLLPIDFPTEQASGTNGPIRVNAVQSGKQDADEENAYLLLTGLLFIVQSQDKLDPGLIANFNTLSVPSYYYYEKRERNFRPVDIQGTVDLPYDATDSCKIYIVRNTDIRVTEYLRSIFAHFRYIDGISESEYERQRLHSSLSLVLNQPQMQKLPTRGTGFRLTTHCKNFIIMQVTDDERRALTDSMIKNLHKHVIETQKNKSLIWRIIGAYTVKLKNKFTYDIVVLENPIPQDVHVYTTFELKGSKLDRQVLQDQTIKNVKDISGEMSLLKDLDFYQIQRHLFLSFSEESWLKEIAAKDIQFLSSQSAQSYSIMVSIGEPLNLSKAMLNVRHSRHTFIGCARDSNLTYFITIADYLNQGPQSQGLGAEAYAHRIKAMLRDIIRCEQL